MSGHSRWAQIKRQKGVADARRSAHFTKLGHAIAVAARGGADPASNFKLRLAVEAARTANMPNDVVQRAVQRGSGTGSDRPLEELTYEAYGPSGVALLIGVLTDNRNRAASEVRRTLADHAATFAAAGSVAWQFQPKGVLRITRDRLPTVSDELELALIDAGAEDIRTDDDGTTITTPPNQLESVQAALTQRRVSVDDAGLESVPTGTIALTPEAQKHLAALLEALDALDDVQSIATNAAAD